MKVGRVARGICLAASAGWPRDRFLLRRSGYQWRARPTEKVHGRSKVTHGGPLDICRIFGLDGRESYRKMRLEPLCCPHRLSCGCSA